MKKKLVWFRNDFRIHDNTALYKASQSDQDIVIALFISTPIQWLKHGISSKKQSFIHYHVINLQKKLLDLNISLHYHESTTFLESVKYLVFFCKKYQINQVFYNYQYEFNERNRDCLAKNQLYKIGVVTKGFHDSLLIPHNKIKTQYHSSYKIFTFFKKKFLPILYNNIPQCYPLPLKRKCQKYIFNNILPNKKYALNFNQNIFPIGEEKAYRKLNNFIQSKMHNYSINKNFPYLDNTSMLSPYLSIGVLSSRQCLTILLKNQKYTLRELFYMDWFNEIIWREFYYHLLIGYPFLSQSQSLQPWEKHINWVNNSKYFDAWKEGKTGIPIIDAGMRQLKKIGWMHNRLRMLTASFLVKNLFINWRKGEKYFMSQLIDGDFALNNGGWQWAASVGSDSVPYIRVFNPVRQSQKIDQSGIFIRNFIPELKKVPESYIHNPHIWAEKENIYLEYPKPIIKCLNTREKFILMLKNARFYSKK